MPFLDPQDPGMAFRTIGLTPAGGDGQPNTRDELQGSGRKRHGANTVSDGRRSVARRQTDARKRAGQGRVSAPTSGHYTSV